jgi:hypothetical protein
MIRGITVIRECSGYEMAESYSGLSALSYKKGLYAAVSCLEEIQN